LIQTFSSHESLANLRWRDIPITLKIAGSNANRRRKLVTRLAASVNPIEASRMLLADNHFTGVIRSMIGWEIMIVVF